MPSLFNFADTSSGLKPQDANLAFGINPTNSAKFRVTSSFKATSDRPVYAVLSGTVLLIQQTTDNTKVNLILKPHDLKDIKLPLKYIIYRGLKLEDFVDGGTDLSLSSVKVKTSGSELLDRMFEIQQQRVSGATKIPKSALFGTDTFPLNDGALLSSFFFENTSIDSQLFTVEGGMELGNFATGEIGIDFMLENQEMITNVGMAKLPYYEIDSNFPKTPPLTIIEQKWEKEKIRHFVDPVAFYGLHYDIGGGIGYRVGGTSNVANTLKDVYENLQEHFLTKNHVYLDIRNENGYSYNAYDNYVGNTGTDDDKELRLSEGEFNEQAKEYYTQGWPIHILTVNHNTGTPTTKFNIMLRTADNQHPLLVSRHFKLSPNVSRYHDKAYSFADKTVLLPETNGFTKSVSFEVPYSQFNAKQPATLVCLDYLRQASPNTISNKFPRIDALDYVFGPIKKPTLPWNSDNRIQWFTNDYTTYFDSNASGYILKMYETSISEIDVSKQEIKIPGIIPVNIVDIPRVLRALYIENTSNPTNVGRYEMTSLRNDGTDTYIGVDRVKGTLQTGDILKVQIRFEGHPDYTNHSFFVKGNQTSFLKSKNEIYLNTYHTDIKGVLNHSIIATSTYDASNDITEITFTSPIQVGSLAGFFETGYIVDADDTTTPDDQRIMMYAAPKNYFLNQGFKNYTSFNVKGGILNFDSMLNLVPGLKIDSINLVTGSDNIKTLSYSSENRFQEALLLLGMTKQEHSNILALSDFSERHVKLLRLQQQGGRKLDDNMQTYFEYKLVLTGLKKDDHSFLETDTGVSVYTTDHLIFASKEFAVKYGVDFTEAENALNKFLENTLNPSKPGSDFKGLADYSKEEEINLKYGEFWTSYGSGKTNKELFELDPSFKDKVEKLKDELDTVAKNITAVEDLLKSKGADLLAHAKTQIKVNGAMKNKDGILYLTRLIMSVVIRNHPIILSSFPTRIQTFLDIFEKHSRGLEGSEKPNFSTYSGHKKILISGFDPFNSNFDNDGHYSNASGNLALALDGKVATTDSGKNIVIKSAIFPVRFKEFDEEWVEDFFKPYIVLPDGNNNKPDMIITFSFFTKHKDFQFDRFAADFRYNLTDNDNYTPNNKSLKNTDPKFNISDTFIKNTLPIEKLVVGDKLEIPDLPPPNETLPKPNLGINHRAFWAIKAKKIGSSTIEYVTSKHKDARSDEPYQSPFDIYHIRIDTIDPTNQHQVSDEIKYFTSGDADYISPPNWIDYADEEPLNPTHWSKKYSNFVVEARKGSGASFLSNEIHYRVAYLREKNDDDLPTGHFHINFMKGAHVTNRNKMIAGALEIIKKLID